VLAGVLVLAVAARSVHSQETPAPKIDPKVAEVVKKMVEYFSALKSLTVDLAVSVNMEGQGTKQHTTEAYAMAMKRPNKFAMVLKEGTQGVTRVCDGKNLYAYFPMMKMYTVKEAPADMDGVLSRPGGENMFVVDSLLASKPYEALMRQVTEAKYVGLEEEAGVKCHHMHFVREPVDWDLWVDAGDKPLPTKLVPDFAKGAAQQAMPEGMKVEVVMTFQNWGVNAEVPDERFTFTPPADAKKVDALMGGARKPEKPAVLGKPAEK
jgi:hypothetical protein